jgi:hypothetical protein
MRRMTAGDYWVLKRGYKMGILSSYDVYKYLSESIFLKFLKNLENNVVYFIFNFLPADIILVELKYFFLRFVLSSVLFE